MDKFGFQATDVITGFTGTVTGFCTYITGCDQYLIAPKMKSSGAIADSKWLDVARLKFGKRMVTLPAKGSDGADVPAPVR